MPRAGRVPGRNVSATVTTKAQKAQETRTLTALAAKPAFSTKLQLTRTAGEVGADGNHPWTEALLFRMSD